LFLAVLSFQRAAVPMDPGADAAIEAPLATLEAFS
jgi:hypothetical protein